jgi:translation initiation factor IF-3
MEKSAALKIAIENELDLVVIAEKTNPPVAKILDFNKYLYDERKKASATKAKSKKSELKEFRFGPTIDEGDLVQRIERARKFLSDGNRVRITVKLKGRQMAHPEIGFEKLERFIKELSSMSKTESEPKLARNIISATLVGQ